jgi:phosphohistidine phosphatase SixA
VQKLDDGWRHVAIFGHNHGLEEFVELLTGVPCGMPTCSVAHIELPAERWRDVRERSGHLKAFLSP